MGGRGLGTHKVHPTTRPCHVLSGKYHMISQAGALHNGHSNCHIVQSTTTEAR